MAGPTRLTLPLVATPESPARTSSTGRRLAGLLALTLALRLVVFPINEYLMGDAVSRVELAEQWLTSPHVIKSFGDGAAQYGPLHLYMIAAALQWFDRTDAAKVISLLFGVLTIVPLFGVTRRYFGDQAATWSCLAFAVWGLHLQLSTTGGSEALALCLMWVATAWFASGLERPRVLPFAASALAIGLAAATRYDAWMYIPILACVPLLQWRDKVAGLKWGLVFLVLCLPYPLFWMAGNAAAHGDPFYPFAYINAFHRSWVALETQAWGALWFRVQGVGFWPAIALVTLTPGVAVLGFVGIVSSVRRYPATRWLLFAAAIPTVYYALRIAIFADFVPLARFTVFQVSLLLPFVAPGFAVLVERSGRVRAERFARAAIAVALAMPLTLGLYTLYVNHSSAEVLESIGPTTTNNPSVMAVAAFVRDVVVREKRSIALDEDATYQDIQLGFYGRVFATDTLRLRWPDFRAEFERRPPEYVVVFERGRLLKESWVQLSGSVLTIGSTTYDAVSGFASPVRVFKKRV